METQNGNSKERTDMLDQLEQLMGQLRDVADSHGIDLAPSKDQKTGYDYYHWTFNEKKRIHQSAWSIDIPDGFV